MVHSGFVLFLYAVVSGRLAHFRDVPFFILFYTGLSVPELDCLEKCREMEAECRKLWMRAMSYSPKLACYCTHWNEFTPAEWASMLVDNRNLINVAPVHLLGFKEWGFILNYPPTLIEHCPVINDFPANAWNALLKIYPWFSTYRENSQTPDRQG